MNHCPQCKTTRRPELNYCHGCQFEFGDVLPSNGHLISSINDAALGIALLLASFSALLNITFCGVAFLSRISNTDSRLFENAFAHLVFALISYVIAIVLWRVLNLPK